MIAAPGLDAPPALRLRLADLYCAYADALDEGDSSAGPISSPRIASTRSSRARISSGICRSR